MIFVFRTFTEKFRGQLESNSFSQDSLIKGALRLKFKTTSLTCLRCDASFEALKQKLASVMPTHAGESHSNEESSSHPASATQTVHRVIAPHPHLPSVVEDPARKSGTESNGSSQESESKKNER